MDFLAKLGKDDVEQTKRRGTKLVVIDKNAIDRYHVVVIGPRSNPGRECDVLTTGQQQGA